MSPSTDAPELHLQVPAGDDPDSGFHDPVRELAAARVQQLGFDQRLDHEARVKCERIRQQQPGFSIAYTPRALAPRPGGIYRGRKARA